MERVHLLIRGRVQGVYFRGAMTDEARGYGLNGWVRNLPDGRTVEAVVEGPRENIKSLLGWCWQGPALARVDEIQENWEPAVGNLAAFSVRY